MQSMMYCIGDLTVITPAQLTAMRSAGVTVVKNGYYAGIDYTQAGLTAWLDAVHAAGLTAIIDVVQHVYRSATRNLPLVADIISWCDSHPAVVGYYTDDESDGDIYTIAERVAVYDYIKARTSKPTMEVHYQVSPVSGKAAHYPTDGTIVHDIYGIDYYLYEIYSGNATSWQTYINGEYAKLTTVDKANLTHVLQCFGSTLAKVPPDNNLQTVQYPRTITPNNWHTWGVSFYTWRRVSTPGNDSDAWITPITPGYEYLQADIAAVNEAALPATPRTINLQPVTCLPTTGDVTGEQLRILDNGVEKYFPLVATNAPTATAVRFYDGADTWALAAAAVPQTSGCKGLDLSLQLTI